MGGDPVLLVDTMTSESRAVIEQVTQEMRHGINTLNGSHLGGLKFIAASLEIWADQLQGLADVLGSPRENKDEEGHTRMDTTGQSLDSRTASSVTPTATDGKKEPKNFPFGIERTDAADTCGGCGGPYAFDTTVPSAVWNRVVRPLGISEYLCLGCIIRIFAERGEAFTAELWGKQDAFNGLPIRVAIGASADDNMLRRANRNLIDALRVMRKELATQEANVQHLLDTCVPTEELAAEVVSHPPQEEWQPIATALKDGTRLLLYGCEYHRYWFGCGYYFKGVPGDGEGWIAHSFYTLPNNDSSGVFQPTHWQPLPTLPASGEGSIPSPAPEQEKQP